MMHYLKHCYMQCNMRGVFQETNTAQNGAVLVMVHSPKYYNFQDIVLYSFPSLEYSGSSHIKLVWLVLAFFNKYTVHSILKHFDPPIIYAQMQVQNFHMNFTWKKEGATLGQQNAF